MNKHIPGIYIHLPFCTKHCTYCDFPVSTQLSLSGKYYDSLLREIDQREVQKKSDSLYFGGGTPSLTPSFVLKTIREKFDLESNSEITLEANPEDIDHDRIAGWIEMGINRLSLGIQSLQKPVLRNSGRSHSAEQAIRAVKLARDSGFENLNVDLIIGLPDQTVDGFLHDLQQLAQSGPSHFSLYLLEIHDQTVLKKELSSGSRSAMKEEDQVACYQEGIRLLQMAGFEHYEVSNFARPGFQCKHNLKYWNGDPYEGFGMGACSYSGSHRIENVRELREYVERIAANKSPAKERIEEDRETRMRNRLIFGLRKRQGIHVREFEEEFGNEPLSLFGADGSSLLQEGLLELTPDYLRLSLPGMMISNEILSLVV